MIIDFELLAGRYFGSEWKDEKMFSECSKGKICRMLVILLMLLMRMRRHFEREILSIIYF